MEDVKQIKPIVADNNTISLSNILLLQAILKHSSLLFLDCYQIIMLNSRYLVVCTHQALKRQAQRKHFKNVRKY